MLKTLRDNVHGIQIGLAMAVLAMTATMALDGNILYPNLIAIVAVIFIRLL